MYEIALFVEDYAHRQVIGALVQRVADQHGITVELRWRTSVRGFGRFVHELTNYLRDMSRQGAPWPDLIVVATDANCQGFNARIASIGSLDVPAPMVLAVPDPHIERWLLLDGAAFREVFGRGCRAADQKCSRDRYRQQLTDAIHQAGVLPILGGIEYAADIVQHMDLDRAARADTSLQRFLGHLRAIFRGWS